MCAADQRRIEASHKLCTFLGQSTLRELKDGPASQTLLLAGFEESSAQAVEQLAGASLLLRAAAWAQAGDRALAASSARMFLRSHAASARAQDVCLAYAQLAVSAAESQSYAAAEEVPDPVPPPSSPPPPRSECMSSQIVYPHSAASLLHRLQSRW